MIQLCLLLCRRASFVHVRNAKMKMANDQTFKMPANFKPTSEPMYQSKNSGNPSYPTHRIPTHRKSVGKPTKPTHRMPIHRMPTHRMPAHRMPTHRKPADRKSRHRKPTERKPSRNTVFRSLNLNSTKWGSRHGWYSELYLTFIRAEEFDNLLPCWDARLVGLRLSSSKMGPTL